MIYDESYDESKHTLYAFICDNCATKINMTKTGERPVVYCLNCAVDTKMRAS
jgi:formamidopyrimidine-DNA glycosylase